MPAEDVSDLKDVFDAINRLCDTMKTSNYIEPEYVECDEGLVEPEEVFVRKLEIFHADRYDNVCEDSVVTNEVMWNDLASQKPEDWKDSQASLASSEISVHRESWRDIVSPTVVDCEAKLEQWKDSQASLASSEVSVQRETLEERWSDTLTSPPSSDISVTKETRERWSDCRSPPDSAVPQEPSEMYYTASSEVSLLSDTEQAATEEDKGDKKGVIAGHVAAMRERFENMTRANTPCPDLVRSSSPSLDVFRNVTPSPDQLG